MLDDSRFANLSDEQRSRLRKLAWATFGKLVVSFGAAVGTKLGELFVESLREKEDEDDDEPEEPVA
jgi:hypothetical protein